jgi:hypothetical protein
MAEGRLTISTADGSSTLKENKGAINPDKEQDSSQVAFKLLMIGVSGRNSELYAVDAPCLCVEFIESTNYKLKIFFKLHLY